MILFSLTYAALLVCFNEERAQNNLFPSVCKVLAIQNRKLVESTGILVDNNHVLTMGSALFPINPSTENTDIRFIWEPSPNKLLFRCGESLFLHPSFNSSVSHQRHPEAHPNQPISHTFPSCTDLALIKLRQSVDLPRLPRIGTQTVSWRDHLRCFMPCTTDFSVLSEDGTRISKKQISCKIPMSSLINPPIMRMPPFHNVTMRMSRFDEEIVSNPFDFQYSWKEQPCVRLAFGEPNERIHPIQGIPTCESGGSPLIANVDGILTLVGMNYGIKLHTHRLETLTGEQSCPLIEQLQTELGIVAGIIPDRLTAHFHPLYTPATHDWITKTLQGENRTSKPLKTSDETLIFSCS